MTEKKDKSEEKVSAADILSEISGVPKEEVQEIAEKVEIKKEVPASGSDEATDLDDNETGATELEITDETPSGPRTHIVTGGETLSMIAKNYGVDRSQLVRVNKDVKNLRHLVRGQELKIDE